MALKLEYNNKNGSVSFHFKRDMPIEYLINIASLTANLLSINSEQQDQPTIDFSKEDDIDISEVEILEEKDQEDILFERAHQRRNARKRSRKNYSLPILLTKDQMGSYEEPDDGVRIKVYHSDQPLRAVKIIKDFTGINITACRQIVDGIAVCPKLLIETAQQMIEEFKNNNIVAKIVNKDAFRLRVIEGGQEGNDNEGLTTTEEAL